jgi:hypothetical protein
MFIEKRGQCKVGEERNKRSHTLLIRAEEESKDGRRKKWKKCV